MGDTLYGDQQSFQCANIFLRLCEGLVPLDINGTFNPPEVNTLVISVEDLELLVFPNFQHHYKNHKWLYERVAQTPNNSTVNEVNYRLS